VIWDEINATGSPPSRRIGFHPHGLLRAIRREPTGQTNYEKLAAGLDRLQSTTIKTSIRAKDNIQRTFSWIDEWERVDDDSTGHPKHWSITLSRWLYEGIIDKKRILSLHPDYFLVSNETEKWLYRLARKHAGQQTRGFRISLRKLHRKNGTSRAFRKWKHDILKKVTDQVILDYSFDVYEGRNGDTIVHMIRSDLAEAFAAGLTKKEEVKIHVERAHRAAGLPPEKRQAFWMAEIRKQERRRQNEATRATLHKTARSIFKKEVSQADKANGESEGEQGSLFE
jgi:hypothetical protein